MLPDLEPMRASDGVPSGSLDGWDAEPCWEGWRARVSVDRHKVTVRTRTGRAITHAVPGVAPFAVHHRARLLLDGEVVPATGRLVDFYGMAGDGVIGGASAVVFVAFDVLVDDELVIDEPYAVRRRRLEAIDLPGLVVGPSYRSDEAAALLAACEATGTEDVVLKRADSPYLPGARTDAWRTAACSTWQASALAALAR
jgi:bifunctional non-homologous end joining protein LigD